MRPLSPGDVFADATSDSFLVDVAARCEIARVNAVGKQSLQVTFPSTGATHLAKVAAGAMLEPQTGDIVLLAMHPGAAWVTQVLERASPGAAAELTVAGATQVQLTAPELTLSSHELQVEARKATFKAGVATFSADTLKAVARRLATWAESLQTHAQTLVVRSQQRVTQIEGPDVLHAVQVLTQAEQLVRIESERHLQIESKEAIVMDAKRVHVG